MAVDKGTREFSGPQAAPNDAPLRKRRCKSCNLTFFSRTNVKECQNCDDSYDRDVQVLKDAEAARAANSIQEREGSQVSETPQPISKPKQTTKGK